ncbi:MAG: glycosyltransferase family 39 protein [Kiritimatiellae bacterium]|nr:glycosyltransferase family 39 protein [Kiritimatiellia bacterium]MDW8458707.1 glycosyltransferase family 39 protein [Verrucomicrobiota bacterium]
MLQASDIQPSSRWVWFGVAAITILGFALRFHQLGGSTLWIDEITVLTYAAPPKTPGSIIRDIYEKNLRGFTGQHMPMQYVLANLILKGVPPAESVNDVRHRARIPFALLGALTVPIFFSTVRSVYGYGAGLWAALLAAISFFHVYQSRDATSYGPLLFFQSITLWAAVRLGGADSLKARGILWAGFAMVLGMAGMFFTHLISWFFAATLGLLALTSVLARWRSGGGAEAIKSGPALVVLLIGVSALPFVQFPLAAARGAGIVDDVPERVTGGLLAYQLAAFGWGRGGGRLMAFAAVLAWGICAAWRRSNRSWAFGHTVLIVIPSAIFFLVLMRDFYPRYLAVVFLPLIAFAAVGLADIQRRLHGWQKPAGPVFSVMVVAALGLWHWEPYQTLYNIRDKLMPFSIARDWIMQNVPPGGLYMWRNGYFLREVPGALPTPNRSVAFADHPNKGIPREEFARRSAVAQDTFRRFPEAVLITEPPTDAFYPHQDLWKWTEQFPNTAIFHDPTLARLWRWGFSPHGYRMSDMAIFKARWRRPEEIFAERMASGQPSVWPTGSGWRYVQTREGITLATPAGDDCRLRTVVPRAGEYLLRITGTAPGVGRLSFWRIRQGQWFRIGEQVIGRSDGYQGMWGPVELEVGDQLAIKPLNEQVNFLFIYDFVLVSP